MAELPQNLDVVWHNSDISLAEVMKKTRYPDGWLSGNQELLQQQIDYEGQLPENVFREMFLFAVGKAIASPRAVFQFTRYDNGLYVPENANSVAFSGKHPYKRMKYLDYEWKQPMNGRYRPQMP